VSDELRLTLPNSVLELHFCLILLRGYPALKRDPVADQAGFSGSIGVS
jgi:hypothetical protein